MGLIQKLDASLKSKDTGFDRTHNRTEIEGNNFNTTTWNFGEVKDYYGNKQSALVLVTQSTILYLIIFTTVILGGLTPLV